MNFLPLGWRAGCTMRAWASFASYASCTPAARSGASSNWLSPPREVALPVTWPSAFSQIWASSSRYIEADAGCTKAWLPQTGLPGASCISANLGRQSPCPPGSTIILVCPARMKSSQMSEHSELGQPSGSSALKRVPF